MARLTAPTLPLGPRKRLSDALHSAHRRAGWPSVRDLARALGAGVVSASRVHDAFTKPRLPDWGLVRVLLVELAARTPGMDVATEVKRFHTLWDEAAQAEASPANDSPFVSERAAASRPAAAGPGWQMNEIRTMLLAEVSGVARRSQVEQEFTHLTLHRLLDGLLADAGIDAKVRRRIDRGDGTVDLIDSVVYVPVLLRALLKGLRPALESTQLRLRLVLATGVVAVDDYGPCVGKGLDEACRLIDSVVMRALPVATEPFGLCLSETAYQEVAHIPDLRREDFRPFETTTKSGMQQAWLYQAASDGAY